MPSLLAIIDEIIAVILLNRCNQRDLYVREIFQRAINYKLMTRIRVILFSAILFLAISIYYQSYALAPQEVNFTERIVGTAFKNLAKAFVLVADLNKLKENNIAKLKRMDQDKFRKRYAEVYRVIKYLPDKIKHSYRITEAMTINEAIADIGLLDEKRIYEIIDSIPDAAIAGQFRQYLEARKHQLQGSNLNEQIGKIWNAIIGKAR